MVARARRDISEIQATTVDILIGLCARYDLTTHSRTGPRAKRATVLAITRPRPECQRLRGGRHGQLPSRPPPFQSPVGYCGTRPPDLNPHISPKVQMRL